jgi:hypothetical protein
MKHLETQLPQTENWNYVSEKVTYKDTILPKNTVKGASLHSRFLNFPVLVQDAVRHHTSSLLHSLWATG